MTHYERIAAIIVLGFSTVTVAKAQSVPPGKLFSGPVISLRSPQSEGWRMAQSSSAGMAFVSKGVMPEESYVAAVNFFSLKSTSNAEAFLALIKRGVDEDTAKQRFEPIDIKYEYTDQRGYPCVRMSSLVIDKNAATGLFSKRELKLETRSLYCRHPQKQHSGFSVVFSHRGETLDPELDGKAQMFIDEVQVPGYERPNLPLQPTASGGG